MLSCAGLEDRIVLDPGRGLGANLRCVLAAVCGGDAAAAGLQQLLDTAQPASAVNSYVRLVMNLMNAYTRDTEEVR